MIDDSYEVMIKRFAEKKAEEAINKVIDWYRQAYARSNTDPSIIRRNICVLSDAFHSGGNRFISEALSNAYEEGCKDTYRA